MEAMAMGVAVVATDAGGTREVVGSSDTGLLVPAYDPAALAQAIGRLLRDPVLRERVAEGGRRRMETSFSLEAMAAANERLYRDLASRRRAPSPSSPRS
jgi:glycosyltransferase involved in cell wall biosynthesis